MKYHRFILSTFFLLFAIFSSIPTHAKIGDVTPVNEKGPINIEADELIFEKETQVYRAHGQVEISRGDFSLKADHAQMNMATKELVAWGNVLLREGEDVIECERLEVNLQTQQGKIHQAKVFMKDQNFHITSREVEKLGENHYRIRDASLTTCDAKRPPWKFNVKELEVKEMALGGWAIAKGALFYFEEIPVLYFPWGAFPVRLERQTGFLLPKAGYSNKYGPEVKTGFYWAFAKNMDATFYLDYLGDRGFKEGLEYRYALTKETKGEAKFYFIDDQVFNKNRYAFFIEHQQKLPYDFYLKGDINQVSDIKYLDDFKEDLPHRTKIDAASLRQLKSVLFGGKNWDHFSLVAQGAFYNDLTKESNDSTTQKLPQISFYAHPQSLFKTPLFFQLASSYTNFWREKGVEAQRGDLFPRITFPTRLFNVLKFESDLGLRETFYKSRDDSTNRYHGWESRQTLDAGMGISTEFYRVYDGAAMPTISKLFKVSKWMHTIEPTLLYRYSPRVNQKEIPVFDEVDRIPYTNEITYGITQRLVGRPQKETVSSGPYEYAKLIISQSYSLGDPYIDATGKSRSFSNIRGELWWNFDPYISAITEIELNPYRGSFDRLNIAVHAKDRRNDVFQVQYRHTRGSVEEINLDARVKTIDPLYLYGAFRYNLLDRWMVVSVLGGEYQAQCWSGGMFLEYWGRSPDGQQKKEIKFHIYFNLLNIGSVGRQPYFMTW